MIGLHILAFSITWTVIIGAICLSTLVALAARGVGKLSRRNRIAEKETVRLQAVRLPQDTQAFLQADTMTYLIAVRNLSK